MLDPTDYQNVSGVDSGVTNYMSGMGGGGSTPTALGGSWLSQAGNWLGSNSMSQGMGIGGGMSNGSMILAADQMGGQLFGLLAGRNHTKVGNIMKNIPGLSTVGNLINAAFGSDINEEFVNQTKSQTNALGSQIFNSNTNADVLNDWQNMTAMSHVRKSEVGSDGWFSSDAEDTTDDLNRKIDEANRRQQFNFDLAVNNADRNTDFRILSNMTAYGGPINSFRKYYKDGGSPYTVGAIINSLYAFSPKEEFLGEPSHHYDFTQSEEWANAHGYYPDARGHRDDRVKKVSHPSHPSRGTWNGDKFELTDSGMQNSNYTLFGLNDGGQDSQAILTYKGGVVLPEITVTPKENYVFNPYDNIILHQKALGGNLFNTPQFFTFEHQTFAKGGYLNQAKALIRQNEGWREKPYKDAPKGKNWRSVGYGFNDSGFREKYPEGISKHYEHGITKKQAEEELDYFLNKAEKQLKSIYGKQWNDFTDSQKAAILDTYYQRPASVGKSSRFYKAVTAGEDAGRYLGVAGYDKRNKVRQGVFGGSQDYVNLGIETGNTESNPSTLQEVTPFTPVVHDLDLSGITPTQAKALELNLASPVFDLSMFSKPSTPIVQQQTPAIGTVEDFLASYGDFEENLFAGGGWMDFFNMWNQSQGGNNYFGNNWNPSDGLQRTTSNGNAGDWMGVAGTTINTLANWGKEDPSIGRGGGYSMFGMAAYDIMKAIRNATKSKRESIGQKLAIPIYAQGGRLFDDGGSVGALGYANIANSALKLANNVKHQTELDVDEDTIYRSINRFGQDFDKLVGNVNTNGDLLDLWDNNATVTPNLSGRDFRDKSYFDDFLDSYAASWEGFNAGQNFGPWGAAIGAVIGGGSSIIGSIIGRNKADNAADEANEKIERANNRRIHNLIAAAERVDKENDLRILQNMGANGGKLNMGFGLRNPFIMPDGTANPLFRAFGGGLTHGSDWDTGINWVNEGGSHGENPLGGVQMGVDEQGVPNLVEEGEAIWNGDYVFSKRMKVPKKLAQKYGLGGDLTFADAIAKLTKDSEERPLSNIDRATNDHILGEFADTQEELRMAKAQRAMDKEVQLQDDFLTGFQFGLGGHMSPIGIIPDSDNTSIFEKVEQLYADGGGIHIDPSKKGTFKAQASKMGMGVQEAASHILANKENYSPAMVKKANFAKVFAHADGGDLFSNPFAYGGKLGNVFAGEGDRPNTLNLDAANQSLVRRIFGDTGFTRFMENTAEAINDPIGYFAGDEIDAVIDKLGKMSEPQLEKFFRTDIGRAIAPYLAGDDNSQVQKAGMRGAKSVANIVRRVQRPVQIAAKKAMAQSRQVARGQMRQRPQQPTQTSPTSYTGRNYVQEAGNTVDARNLRTGQQWAENAANTGRATQTTTRIKQTKMPESPDVPAFIGRTARTNKLNPKLGSKASTSRGAAPDAYAGLEGTLNMSTPIGSGNFGYLPWIAGAGAGGYGLYKGIDWLADNLTNPDGTITGVNDPATQTAINSLPSEATSNRGNGNKGKAAVTETPAITPEETGAASTRRGAQGSGRGRGNGSGTATRNRGSVVPFTYDWYRNGSDGYSKPWGFTVGQNGLIDKNTGYTDDYRNLVSTLGAKDIKEWAKNHADDPSLRSFLDNNYKGKNYVEKLNAFVNDDKFTDDMWRRGATDGKYGFMHHVADQIGKETATIPADYNWEQEAPWLFGNIAAPETAKPNPMAEIARDKSTPTRSVSVTDNGTNFKVTPALQTVTRSGITDTTSGAVDGITRSPFKPKQTWTRYAPMVMSGIMGLKEMLTPADYTNADAIMAAAYRAGAPVSVGTEYIGDYRKRDPFDERYLMNIISQRGNATNRNMMNLSGGNRAVAMSGILANDLTTQMALAEAARQAYLANRTDDAQVAEFNRGTNQFNATAQNQRNQFLAGLNSQRQQAMLSGISQGARLRQAIKDQRDAAISANLTNFAQGLGDLGKENGYYNMLGGLNEEGILKYFYGDDWKTKFNNVNV